MGSWYIVKYRGPASLAIGAASSTWLNRDLPQGPGWATKEAATKNLKYYKSSSDARVLDEDEVMLLHYELAAREALAEPPRGVTINIHSPWYGGVLQDVMSKPNRPTPT